MPGAVSEIVTKSGKDEGPSLLEERRTWVKHDREAKLDVFLSLAEDVMLDVFEVGPPLPPTSMNARDMMAILEDKFMTFTFEAYHHAFCHFLNLHIDQYETLAEFNQEFSTTLEDLLDHGHPLSNTQACSAYFSKLRCTQNPWVVKMLEQWDSHLSEPQLQDLMQESPPWSIIRPLATKSSQHNHGESATEESVTQTDSDMRSEPSPRSSPWTSPTHSRHTSSTTMRSQDIIIHAALNDINPTDIPFGQECLKALPTAIMADRHGSETTVRRFTSDRKDSEVVSDWLEKRIAPPRRSFTAPPPNRPLPALPTSKSQASPVITPREETLTPPTPEHPALRNTTRSSEQLLVNIHPSVRPTTPIPRPSTANGLLKRPQAPIFAGTSPFPPFDSPEINIAMPFPPTPDISEEPPALLPPPSNPIVQNLKNTPTAGYSFPPTSQPIHIPSTNSSLLSLPLQGTTTPSSWTSSTLHTPRPQQPSSSQKLSSSLPPSSFLPLDADTDMDIDITALPPIQRTATADSHIGGRAGSPPTSSAEPAKIRKTRSKTLSISHLGGLEVEREKERERDKEKDKKEKKKVWSLGRFGHGKGVKEII